MDLTDIKQLVRAISPDAESIVERFYQEPLLRHNTPTDKAFSYIRFSSERQERGDSLRRQTKLAEDYAVKHGLVLDTSTYQDLGISAFKGKHALEGKLGLFLTAIEKGLIPKGSRLLVESLDRLSRETVDVALELFLRIIRSGVTIVTLIDQQEYSSESIRDNWTKLIISLAEMARAHGESATKSRRVAEGWENARKTKTIITRMAPAWLSTEDGKTWIVNKVRVEVVKRIFKLAHDEGMGTPTIDRTLNAENVPTFGDADGWSAGVVAHILKNKAVVGVLESPKVGTREGYYPAIIKREIFDATSSLLSKRNFAPSPRTGGSIGNIFAGRSYCGVCGARMKSVSQHANGLYIHCDNAYKANGKCDARRVAYHSFEEDILKHLILAQHRSLFQLQDEVAVDPRMAIQGALDDKEKDIEKAMDILMSVGKSEAVMSRLKKLEVERDELRNALKNAVVIPKTTEVLRHLLETYTRYVELEKTDKSSDGYKALRRTLQVGLRNAVAKVELHHKPGDERREHYRVTFLSGTVRERTYTRQPKGFQPGNKNGKR